LEAQAIKADAYYDQVLSLFAPGWREKRYAFSAKGKAEMAWQKSCKNQISRPHAMKLALSAKTGRCNC
jgi:hypothetical protein